METAATFTPAQPWNLLTNGGFEDGLTGWSVTALGGASCQIDTGVKAAGAQSLRMDSSGLGVATVRKGFAATPGERYWAALSWAGTAAALYVYIEWLDGSGQAITESEPFFLMDALSGAWERAWLLAQAHAECVSANLVVTVCGAVALNVDECLAAPKEAALALSVYTRGTRRCKVGVFNDDGDCFGWLPVEDYREHFSLQVDAFSLQAGAYYAQVVDMAATQEYLSATGARVKSPNYFLVVKDWGGQDRFFAMKPVKGATRPYIMGLTALKAISQKVAPEEGKSSIGSMNFSLLDKNDRVTALLASAIRRKRVELWAGYDELDEADYIRLTTNLVDELDCGKGFIEYAFKTADIQRSIKSRVFQPKVTSLSAELVQGATTATVDDTSNFTAVAHPSLGTCGYLRVGDEILKWTAKTATTFTVARGQFGTTDEAHSSGGEVKELIVFQEHPVAVALKVLLSTGTGSNGTYDTLPGHWGLGIDSSLVRVSAWESEATAWLRFKASDLAYGYQFRFIYGDEVEGKKFIEEEVLKVLNAYAPIASDGALSFKAFSPPVPFADLPRFDEKVLQAKAMGAGLASIINIALFEYDHDLIQGEYLKSVEYSDGESISAHGESDTHKVPSRGIRSDLNGADLVLERWNRIKQRYARPVPVVQAKAFYAKHLNEVGELINFSHPHLPDFAAGSRGLSEKVVEIVNKGFDLLAGALHYDMMLTGFGRRYCLYGPDSLPAYAGATAEQKKRYGWYADADGKVGGAEEGHRYA